MYKLSYRVPAANSNAQDAVAIQLNFRPSLSCPASSDRAVFQAKKRISAQTGNAPARDSSRARSSRASKTLIPANMSLPVGFLRVMDMRLPEGSCAAGMKDAMNGQPDSHGPGSLGTPTNNPALDSGTSARVRNKPKRPLGTIVWNCFEEDVFVPVAAHGTKLGREGWMFPRQDKQGRYILDQWLSGTADVITLDSDDWGDYMRAEPNLREEIYKKLNGDAHDMWETVQRSSGTVQQKYDTSFHGDVAIKSSRGKPKNGGYYTGYELLHGSKGGAFYRAGSQIYPALGARGGSVWLKDVQIKGEFIAVRSGAAGSPYTVTYKDLHFVWNDVVNPNPIYTKDPIYAGYAKWRTITLVNRSPGTISCTSSGTLRKTRPLRLIARA